MKSRILQHGFCRLVWVLGLFVTAAAVGQDLVREMTRQAVIEEMGPPRNRLARGEVEVFQYGDGVKLTFRDGRLKSAQGIKLTSDSIGEALVENAPVEIAPVEIAPVRVEVRSETPPPTDDSGLASEKTAPAVESTVASEPPVVESLETPEPEALDEDWPGWATEEGEWDEAYEADPGVPAWLSFPIIVTLNSLVLFLAIQLGYNFASVSGQNSEVWRVAIAFALISGLIDLLPMNGHFEMILFWGIILMKGVVMMILLRLLTYLRSFPPIVEIALTSMIAHTMVSIWIGAFVVTLIHGLFF